MYEWVFTMWLVWEWMLFLLIAWFEDWIWYKSCLLEWERTMTKREQWVLWIWEVFAQVLVTCTFSYWCWPNCDPHSEWISFWMIHYGDIKWAVSNIPFVFVLSAESKSLWCGSFYALSKSAFSFIRSFSQRGKNYKHFFWWERLGELSNFSLENSKINITAILWKEMITLGSDLRHCWMGY